MPWAAVQPPRGTVGGGGAARAVSRVVMIEGPAHGLCCLSVRFVEVVGKSYRDSCVQLGPRALPSWFFGNVNQSSVSNHKNQIVVIIQCSFLKS